MPSKQKDRMGRGEKHRRVQFDFSPEEIARVRWIVENTEHRTTAEVVRNAMIVYEWLVKGIQDGDRLYFCDSQTGRKKREVMTVALLAVKQRGRSTGKG